MKHDKASHRHPFFSFLRLPLFSASFFERRREEGRGKVEDIYFFVKIGVWALVAFGGLVKDFGFAGDWDFPSRFAWVLV